MLIPFGKFKGMSVEDLVKKRLGYADWLLQQSWFDTTTPLGQELLREFHAYFRTEHPTLFEGKEIDNEVVDE